MDEQTCAPLEEMGRKFINEKKVSSILPSCQWASFSDSFHWLIKTSLTSCMFCDRNCALSLLLGIQHSRPPPPSRIRKRNPLRPCLQPTCGEIFAKNSRLHFTWRCPSKSFSPWRYPVMSLASRASERSKFHPSKYVPLCGGFGAEIRGTPSRHTPALYDALYISFLRILPCEFCSWNIDVWVLYLLRCKVRYK